MKKKQQKNKLAIALLLVKMNNSQFNKQHQKNKKNIKKIMLNNRFLRKKIYKNLKKNILVMMKLKMT